MPQIDVILKFASLAAALADPVVQQHVVTDPDTQQVSVMSDHVIPDIKVWRASQDVAGTDAQGNSTITNNYLSGYYALVSLDHIVPGLRDHPAVQIVINRENNTIIRRGTGIGLALLNDLRFAPVYMGCTYPFGNWS